MKLTVQPRTHAPALEQTSATTADYVVARQARIDDLGDISDAINTAAQSLGNAGSGRVKDFFLGAGPSRQVRLADTTAALTQLGTAARLLASQVDDKTPLALGEATGGFSRTLGMAGEYINAAIGNARNGAELLQAGERPYKHFDAALSRIKYAGEWVSEVQDELRESLNYDPIPDVVAAGPPIDWDSGRIPLNPDPNGPTEYR